MMEIARSDRSRTLKVAFKLLVVLLKFERKTAQVVKEGKHRILHHWRRAWLQRTADQAARSYIGQTRERYVTDPTRHGGLYSYLLDRRPGREDCKRLGSITKDASHRCVFLYGMDDSVGGLPSRTWDACWTVRDVCRQNGATEARFGLFVDTVQALKPVFKDARSRCGD